MNRNSTTGSKQLFIAAAAAFSTYFCMYAFRKPFTAAEFTGGKFFEFDLKATLVISQLMGYMLSKFIGIKLVSELNRRYRAAAIIFLILIAQFALVGFALVPLELKFLMMFFNGLPLGMIFGFVLSYLEGRKQTEALSAVLCASFIISSGVVKTAGQWLIQELGFSEFDMPMIVGLIFLIPLLVSVWLLQKTPPPNFSDIELRSERKEMSSFDRWRFFRAYWPGLLLLFFVYILLTVIRTIRDDFGVELWRELGVSKKPEVFTQSETMVAILVTALNAVAILFRNNLAALNLTMILMALAFLFTISSALMQGAGILSPLAFMILCGVGLYLPYVAFHTTVFERILSASRLPGNLAFLMYLADSIGYLGYALVLTTKDSLKSQTEILPMFRHALIVASSIAVVCLLVSAIYFRRVLSAESKTYPREKLENEST